VFKTAEKTCKHIAPFSLAKPGRESHQELLKQLQSAACMRSPGYPNWPDQGIPAGVDTSSPQFQAAAKKCGLPLPP
jgi:hypothetical protein